jgi:HK97 family phage major capsid protein
MTPARLGDYTRDQMTQLRALDFVRFVGCLVQTNGAATRAASTFIERWPRSVSHDLIHKAAVSAGTTTDGTYSPIVSVRQLADAFVSLSRAASLIGQIPNLRKVPFNTAVAVQTGGGTYGWVGEAKPKPVSALGLATTALGFAKIAGIIVLTDELARLSSPAAEDVVKADMIAGVAAFMDQQFVDPTVAGVATVNPAAITNGITPIAPTATTGAALLTDLKALIKAFRVANGSVANLVLLMNPDDVFTLNGALGKTDASVAVTGYMGIPILVSASVGAQIVAIDPTAILVADDGDMTIDVAKDTSLQMNSTPDSPGTAATVLVSLWQHNMIGLRVERMCTWARARAGAVATLGPTAYV